MKSQTSKRVAVVFGTRPEIIKLAPVVRELGNAARLVHTGQHYDPNMTDTFMHAFDLPGPSLQLSTGGLTRGGQVGNALVGIESFLRDNSFGAVLVQGDTNTTLAGALAAVSAGIPLVHVEAGLRSYDRSMPEEHNRVLVDHLADLACAATVNNKDNLVAENIPTSRIAVTGNTVVEAVHEQLPSPEVCQSLLEQLELRSDSYVLVTIHRPENTDDPRVLAEVLAGLDGLARTGRTVVLPIHPRTSNAISRFWLGHMLERLHVLPPLSYPQFLALAANAALLVSDSGGIQEEVTVVKRPLLVIRRSTERPEAIGHFAARIDIGQLQSAAELCLAANGDMLARLADIPSPFGDGHAAKRIAELTQELIATN
jgi:UDP-N-acetylglucosamine 2-epimerase (non-hydrolysing)